MANNDTRHLRKRTLTTGDTITEPINLPNSNEVTIRELAEKVIQLTNSRSAIVFRPLPIDVPVQRQPNADEVDSC